MLSIAAGSFSKRHLTLRSNAAGGDPLQHALLSPRVYRPNLERIILLVHGYNVTTRAADAAYASFQRMLAVVAPSLVDDCVRTFWPGDWKHPVIKILAFTPRMLQTKTLGPLLGEGLSEFQAALARFHQPKVPIVFVAHSLGCRLVLEALKWLDESSRAEPMPVNLIMLMAAAVPVAHLEDGGRLRAALTRRCDRAVVLHSTSDIVLRGAFPPGQLAGETGAGLWPEAVGKAGNPTGLRASGGLWDHSEAMRGSGHGDYWTSWGVAKRLARELGVIPQDGPRSRVVAPSRATQDRQLSGGAVSTPDRRLGAA